MDVAAASALEKPYPPIRKAEPVLPFCPRRSAALLNRAHFITTLCLQVNISMAQATGFRKPSESGSSFCKWSSGKVVSGIKITFIREARSRHPRETLEAGTGRSCDHEVLSMHFP